MKPCNRIPSITRWPLPVEDRLNRAETEVAFYQVMSKMFGDKFETPVNMAMFKAANTILVRVKPTDNGDGDAVEN